MKAMRLSVILASSVCVLVAATANAGGVQIGLVNGSEFDKWNCGGPVAGLSRTKSRCGNAKFDDTSSCDTVIVTNDSNEQVRSNSKSAAQVSKNRLIIG